jgi:hypothetical protein
MRSGNLTSTMRQGMGVRCFTLISAMLRGMCPFRAPTKKSLEGRWLHTGLR